MVFELLQWQHTSWTTGNSATMISQTHHLIRTCYICAQNRLKTMSPPLLSHRFKMHSYSCYHKLKDIEIILGRSCFQAVLYSVTIV
jgi:hypothetical protein